MYQSINYKFEKALKIAYWLFDNEQADVAELVDATDSKSVFFGSAGSSPVIGTIKAYLFKLGWMEWKTGGIQPTGLDLSLFTLFSFLAFSYSNQLMELSL